LPKYVEILKNRNFVLYNIGQLVSQFADRLIHLALIGIVYKIAPGSTVQLAKVLFFTVFPSFLISPIAGVFVDRLNKKKVLIAADIIRSMAVITIPLFFLKGPSLIPVYSIVFIVFASACFFFPAKLSIIPDLVKKEKLLISNSFALVSSTMAGIIGFSLGAFLVEYLGIQKGLYLNSLAYLISAATLSLLSVYKIRSVQKVSFREVEKDLGNAIKKSFLHDLKEGIIYLFSHRNARFVVGSYFVLMSAVGSLYVVVVVFVQEITHTMTASIGFFGMFAFIGFLIGSSLYGKFGHNFGRSKAIFISFISGGIFVILFAVILKLTSSYAWGCFIVFLLGVVISPVATSGNTIIHETIDENMRGRVFSSIGIIMNLGFLIFMLLSSFLAERIDRMWVIIMCGSAVSLVGIVGYIVNKKEGFVSLR